MIRLNRKILNHTIGRGIERVIKASQHTNRAFSPRDIGLDFTWNCNLNCTMCSHRASMLEKNNLDLKHFQYIIEQLPKLVSVNIVGLGEPLLNPDLFEVLNFAESKDIRVTITTNATLLNESNIGRLTSSLTRVYVSLDSPYHEKYEKIRVGANFNSVKENIIYLKKLRPDIELYVQAVLMKENVEDLPELVRFAKSINADGISLLHIASLNEEDDKRHVSSVKDGDVEHYLRDAKELAREYDINLHTLPLQPRLKRCSEPWFAPYIAINGDIYPCCFIYRIPQPFTEWYLGVTLDVPMQQYKMGNIFEDSVEEIWNGSEFRLLRKVIRESEKDEKLLPEEFNQRRMQIDLEEKFSYCRVCLWRWSCAC